MLYLGGHSVPPFALFFYFLDIVKNDDRQTLVLPNIFSLEGTLQFSFQNYNLRPIFIVLDWGYS
jgi:hypothetical protein